MRLGLFSLLSLLALCVGCRSLFIRAPASLEGQDAIVRGQLLIYTDFPLPPDERLLEELVAMRDVVAGTLAIDLPSTPIHVFLFRDSATYQGFLEQHFPGLPDRRAFFLDDHGRLTVYAQWGDRVAEDLRHEVAHGYLHTAMRRIPMWLDEGLAEYFETPPSARGLNEPHVRLLTTQLEAEGWQPDLYRLQNLDSIGQMQQIDYAESWAWVHFLLQTTDNRRDLLRGYLAELARAGDAVPLTVLLRKLHYQPERSLSEHVGSLR